MSRHALCHSYMSFVRLLSPCNYFLQGKLCGLQIDLPKTNTNIGIIASILACFVKSMVPTKELEVSKEHISTTKIKVHAKVNRLPPSSFT